MSNIHHACEKMYNVSNIQDKMGKRECSLFDLSPLSWIFSLPVLLPLLPFLPLPFSPPLSSRLPSLYPLLSSCLLLSSSG